MKQISYNEIFENLDFYLDEMKSGKIFIYPTDTVYGIGCNAELDNQVVKIFEIKKREAKPLLVITPSFRWIKENCDLNGFEVQVKEKFPGPYSFVVRLNNMDCISSILLCGRNTLGIRQPDCTFLELVEKAQIPFITTSVNLSGEPSALSLDDIKEEILEKVDYVIESDNKLLGKASFLFDITTNEMKQLR